MPIFSNPYEAAPVPLLGLCALKFAVENNVPSIVVLLFTRKDCFQDSNNHMWPDNSYCSENMQ